MRRSKSNTNSRVAPSSGLRLRLCAKLSNFNNDGEGRRKFIAINFHLPLNCVASSNNCSPSRSTLRTTPFSYSKDWPSIPKDPPATERRFHSSYTLTYIQAAVENAQPEHHAIQTPNNAHSIPISSVPVLTQLSIISLRESTHSFRFIHDLPPFISFSILKR